MSNRNNRSSHQSLLPIREIFSREQADEQKPAMPKPEKTNQAPASQKRRREISLSYQEIGNRLNSLNGWLKSLSATKPKKPAAAQQIRLAGWKYCGPSVDDQGVNTAPPVRPVPEKPATRTRNLSSKRPVRPEEIHGLDDIFPDPVTGIFHEEIKDMPVVGELEPKAPVKALEPAKNKQALDIPVRKSYASAPAPPRPKQRASAERAGEMNDFACQSMVQNNKIISGSIDNLVNAYFQRVEAEERDPDKLLY